MFLKLLHPRMDHLLSSFVDAGVYDLDCLLGLADLPVEDQRDFLRDDLRLDALKVRIICVALDKLRSNPPIVRASQSDRATVDMSE